MMSIFIEPHERCEAMNAYKDRLSREQLNTIDTAPETAIIQLRGDMFRGPMTVVIIEEG